MGVLDGHHLVLPAELHELWATRDSVEVDVPYPLQPVVWNLLYPVVLVVVAKFIPGDSLPEDRIEGSESVFPRTVCPNHWNKEKINKGPVLYFIV